MRKKIKRYGNSLVIVFSKEDCETYGLGEGDVVDISDMLIQVKEEDNEQEKLGEEERPQQD